MKRTKVVSLAAAALLAVVPATVVAVKNAPTKIVLAAENEDVKDGSTAEKAKVIIYKNDDLHTKISIHPDNIDSKDPDSDQITDEDVVNYYEKSSQLYINGTNYDPKKDQFRGNLEDDLYTPKDPDYQHNNAILKYNGDYQGVGEGYGTITTANIKDPDVDIPTKLKVGDEISVSIDLPYLERNTWYTWTTTKDVDKLIRDANEKLKSEGGLPQEYLDNIKYTKNGDTWTVAEKTNDYGDFPSVFSSGSTSNDYEGVIKLPSDYILPDGNFIISDDKDAFRIDHDGIKGERVEVPDTDDNLNVDDKGNVNDPTINNNTSSSDNSVVDNDVSKTDNTVNTTTTVPAQPNVDVKKDVDHKDINDNNTNTNKKIISKAPEAMYYSHNAYFYDKNGKVLKKFGNYWYASKYHKLAPLDNGKIYTIKVKPFYRVGKNKYVKVAIAAKLPRKINLKGSRKGTTLYFYTSKGKFAHKFTTSKKNIKFNSSKFIEGFLYYKVAGKKLWVRAKDINLAK